MAKYKNLSEFLAACMDAVRAQKGTSGKIVAENLPDEITSIPAGGSPLVLQELTAKENKIYLPPSGVDGYNKVTVDVTVPIPAVPLEYALATVAADVDSGEAIILRGSDFVKANRANPGFFAIVIPASVPPVGYICLDYGSNRPFGIAGGNYTGVTFSMTNSSNTVPRLQTGHISGNPEGYGGCLLSNSRGDIFCYAGGLLKLKAGAYHIIMGVLP